MSGASSLSESEIRSRLAAEAPRWTFDGGALHRVFKTFGWKGALMAANAIGHLAEVAWHHPDLHISYDTLDVALSSHDAGGVTERDFALARRIDALLDWRPDREGSALTGNPSDERHGYLRYD
jgi:4a-hydroxytetrahydrobiopterin dehydratase